MHFNLFMVLKVLIATNCGLIWRYILSRRTMATRDLSLVLKDVTLYRRPQLRIGRTTRHCVLPDYSVSLGHGAWRGGRRCCGQPISGHHEIPRVNNEYTTQKRIVGNCARDAEYDYIVC